ncbi:MAG: hypothetical protein IKV87_00240 [Methanobrevibacter sp.]|nr:hypothetical protein [Methanobrevibacter sp.]
MERESYYFLLLLIGLAICAAVFWFQFTSDTPTYLIFNTTEVEEGGSFSGVLNDAYGFPVANKTITYHKPGYQMGTLVDVQTDNEGEFVIDNVEYLEDAGDDNYYGDFTFAGDGKYQGCSFDGKIPVIPK